MVQRLREVLEGTESNYILPFMWQRGEGEAIIREEMSRIYEAGIRAVCIESRPHPDFLGPLWWADMDVVMDEARKRGMRVWVFDDDHFPTGHAGGKLKDAPQELRRMYLVERHIDALGPGQETSFLLDPWLSDGEMVEGVIAAKRDAGNYRLTGELIDVSAMVQDNVLYWAVPEGFWRIFILIRTSVGPDRKYDDYVNPLVADSVRVLIDAIYEAYYERYRDDFGGTFAGFFSDEPGFYNDPMTYDFQSALGKQGVPLPWSPALLSNLESAFGSGYGKYLPLLWYEADEDTTSAVRYTYMDVVSRLYGRHFSKQLGDWCRDRKVEYIGHIIEDNNVHARLGCGAGHFFRAMAGQDMSGVDVVLWQLVPGFDEAPFTWIAGETDSEFFHYGLAKLASSLGHIDPKKKGRTVAEVFGAFGWAEGLKLMKWLTDHMLVRGVNYFIPHAFSQKEFPDPDCPPHFYARGQNPQYRYYKILNHYTNRMSHLLSGGRHRATAAVLYHAEAEWSGASMYFHRPVKELARNQIDCDVLPIDALLELAQVRGGKLMVGIEDYRCIIIPFAEALPKQLLHRLHNIAEQGVPLLFVDALPKRSSEGAEVSELLQNLSVHPHAAVVPLSELSAYVQQKGWNEIVVSRKEPFLRYYHYEQPGFELFMFFNEHPSNNVHAQVQLPLAEDVRMWKYDALHNKVLGVKAESSAGKLTVPLRLSPYESAVFVSGNGLESISEIFLQRETGELKAVSHKELEIKGPWIVGIATSEQYPVFATWQEINMLGNMSSPDRLPQFSGTFRYETQFAWIADENSSCKLDLGSVYETVEVWVNEQSVGAIICPPYVLDITSYVQTGSNRLVIEVTNTLVKHKPDPLSRFVQQEPSGLLGPVKIIY